MSKEPTPAEKMLGGFAPKLVERITHLAFYAGWPNAMSAILVAKEVFAVEDAQPT